MNLSAGFRKLNKNISRSKQEWGREERKKKDGIHTYHCPSFLHAVAAPPPPSYPPGGRCVAAIVVMMRCRLEVKGTISMRVLLRHKQVADGGGSDGDDVDNGSTAGDKDGSKGGSGASLLKALLVSSISS
jgi:hypothetical protein